MLFKSKIHQDIPLVLADREIVRGQRFFIIATPPEEHVVLFKPLRNTSTSTYTIQVPWLIWLIQTVRYRDTITWGTMRVNMIKGNPQNGSNKLFYRLPLPNVGSGGSICFGGAHFPYLSASSSVAHIINEGIITFWGSGFNKDYSDAMTFAFDVSVAQQAFEKWQKSAKNMPWNVAPQWPDNLKDLKDQYKFPTMKPVPLLDSKYSKQSVF